MSENQSKHQLDMVNEILTRYGVNLLRPASKNGKKGFTDIAGHWVIQPVYDDVDVFREGVAWVKTGDRWGLIDRDGKILIEPQYEAARELNDGLANVRVNGLWGVIDKSGNIVVRPEFDAIYTFENGVALVRVNGKYGFVFSADNRVISPIYTKAHAFREGLAAVMQGDKWGFIDMDGNMVIAPEYDDVEDFRDGTATVQKKPAMEGQIDRHGNLLEEYEGEPDYEFHYDVNPDVYDCSAHAIHGYMDRKGNFIIKPKYQDAYRFCNGLAKVEIDNKCGIIDRSGAYVIEPEYDDIDRIDSKDRILRVRKDGKYGFIDLSGRYIVEPTYTSTPVRGVYEDTIEVIGDNYKRGFIDIEGKVIAEPQFEDAESFSNGYARVQLDEKWGCIDKSGSLFVKPLYDTIFPFRDNRAKVDLDDRWGFVDREGNLVIKPDFDDTSSFHNGVAAVCVSGKWGLIDLAGKFVLEPSYDMILEIWNSDDFRKIRLNNKIGIVNIKGKTIVEPVYDDISFSDEGVFVVGVKEEKEDPDNKFLPFSFNTVWKYGLIDIDGKVILPPTYAYSDNPRGIDRMEFHEGLAAVCVNDKWGYINARGEIVIEPQFEKTDHFNQGIAYIQQDRLYGLIDRSGNIIVTPQYTNISSEIKNGYIRVENEEHRWGVIDTSGRMVVKPEHNYAFGDCAEGMVRIQHGESFGYADCRTGDIIQPVYDYVWEFSEGLGAVRLLESQIKETPALARASYRGKLTRAESDGKYGFVNQKGQWVIVPKFDDAKPEFTNGVVFVKEGDKWGLINMVGQYTVPPTYDDNGSDNYHFVNNRSTVYINGEKKIIDSDGSFYHNSHPSDADQSTPSAARATPSPKYS